MLNISYCCLVAFFLVLIFFLYPSITYYVRYLVGPFYVPLEVASLSFCSRLAVVGYALHYADFVRYIYPVRSKE